MKKTILALAALGAISTGASAQSNVEIYGVVDIGIARTDDGAPGGSTTGMSTGNLYGSRLGFRGTEDLGGGLKANFNFEQGIDPSTGATTAGATFGRQAWLGMSGGFGTVKAGRMWSPYYTAFFSVDPFADGLLSGATNLMGAGGYRMSNAVNYLTPAMGGFYGDIAYGFGETSAAPLAGSVYSLKTGYAAGPIDVMVAYHNQNNNVGVGGAAKSLLLGATYDFKVAKLHVGLDRLTNDTTAGGTVMDQRDGLLGVSVPLGKGTLLATYIRKSDKLAANSDAQQTSIGYTYPMSKRTILYTAFSHMSNDAGSRARLGATAPAGASASSLLFGAMHSF